MTKTHRVGAFTLGCILIFFGILFLVHMIFPALSYEIIFHLWPCIFILMGLEILSTQISKEKITYIYDKRAVFLLILMAFLASAMAFLDTVIHYQHIYF